MKGRFSQSVTLYNVIFPLWFLILFPPVWLYVIPANFVVDSMVVLLVGRCCGVADLWGLYRRNILKVCIIGFASDILGLALPLGGLLLYGEMIFPKGPIGDWFNKHIANPLTSNPFDSIWAVLVALAAVVLAGWLIWRLNRRFCFRHDADGLYSKKISLALAVFTAPWLVYIPTKWWWR